jgi:diguanylate cyclase (GGDEF)-like protein/PAS domain S-box-containing protein
LEELTAGEVDAVADHSGSPFLLRSAQEQLRVTDAARLAAILDALPAHIALLDSQGQIVSVNAAWQQFAGDITLQIPRATVGLNYLEICEQAHSEGTVGAGQVAEGIRTVLAGTAPSFSVEYAGHSPTQQRWFLIMVTPLPGVPPNGAVVMYLDTTAAKEGGESLRRFSTAMDALPDAIFLIDRSSMRLIHANDTACRFERLTHDELLARAPWTLYSTSPAELEATYEAMISSGRAANPVEIQRTGHDGALQWIEVRRHPQYTGGRWTVVTLVRDITERKRAEARIAYLNRVYAMLSGINTLIVRARDREELFREACRIAVESGGFRLAMISRADHKARSMVPVASAGVDEGLVHAITDVLSSSDSAPHTLLALAVSDKKTLVFNDAQSDPDAVLAGIYTTSDIRSVAVLPLVVSDVAVGVLALYAGESAFFQEDEMRLLTELASDIAFAMDHIDKQERLNYLAYYDVLTGLANRSLFLERLAQSMRSATRNGHSLAIVLIDLERFKNINDSLGQAAGDQLLRQVADWFIRQMGDANVLARLDADHFAVLLPVVAEDGSLEGMVADIVNAFLEHPFHLNDAVFRLAAKAGVALFPGDGADAPTLFMHAEAALKKAKNRGERYLLYTQAMSESVVGKLTLENQLRQALDRNEFVLYYQPKVDLLSGKVTSVEALIRWNDPRSGLVPPAQFIPVLEETGLIHDVGRWALHQAIADYLRWRAAGLAAVRVAVNVSALQLRSRSFLDEVRQAINVDPHAAAGLEIEITESLIMEDVKHSIASLQAIRDMGIRIAIDDFGTGFSSLSYLSRFPVDTLKIDRSFVVEMTGAPQNLALVSTIINLAHALKLKVVAEGVETQEQERLLRLLNCDEMQGYLFSPPLPGAALEARYLGPSAA